MISYRLIDARVLSFVLALFLSVAGQSQTGPQQPPPKQDDGRLRIDTELVQIDVVVTDKAGKPVGNLNREDFQLFEDGRPQSITHFAIGSSNRPAAVTVEARKNSGKEPPVKELARAGIPAVNTPVPAQSGRYLVLAVDDLSLTPQHLLEIRRTLRRFVNEQMASDDQAAIITTSGNLGLLQQFTRNRFLLRHAIDRLQVGNPAVTRPSIPHISDYQAELIESNDHEALAVAIEELLSSRHLPTDNEELINRLIEKNDPIVRQAQSLARRIVTENTQRTTITLSTLEKYIRLLRPLPGRKIMFLLSDGFLLGGPSNNKQQDLLRIADAATRSNVAIYSLDVRGQAAGVPGRDATVEARFSRTLYPGAEVRIALQGFDASRDGLNSMALDTGGFPLFNNNDLNDGLRRVLEENETYYLLAYEPESSYRDGRFHKLEVRVPGRLDLKVHTRKGYYAPDDQALAKKAAKLNTVKSKGKQLDPAQVAKAAEDAEIQRGLDSLFPVRGIPVEMAADFANSPILGPVAFITAHVDAARLEFAQTGNLRHAAVDLAGVIFDEKGKLAGNFSDHIELNLSPESFEQALKNGLNYRKLAPLKPGLYQVRLAVREEATAQLGSAFQWVEIGDPSKKPYVLSSVLFLAEKDDFSALVQAGPNGEGLVTFDQPRLAQTARRFKRGSQVDFLALIYNAGANAEGAGDALIQKQLYSGSKLINSSSPTVIKFSAGQTGEIIPYTERLLLTSLAPGDYELRLIISNRSGKVIDSRSIGFAVE